MVTSAHFKLRIVLAAVMGLRLIGQRQGVCGGEYTAPVFQVEGEYARRESRHRRGIPMKRLLEKVHDISPPQEIDVESSGVLPLCKFRRYPYLCSSLKPRKYS
jgi:hypothetical protein